MSEIALDTGGPATSDEEATTATSSCGTCHSLAEKNRILVKNLKSYMAEVESARVALKEADLRAASTAETASARTQALETMLAERLQALQVREAACAALQTSVDDSAAAQASELAAVLAEREVLERRLEALEALIRTRAADGKPATEDVGISADLGSSSPRYTSPSRRTEHDANADAMDPQNVGAVDPAAARAVDPAAAQAVDLAAAQAVDPAVLQELAAAQDAASAALSRSDALSAQLTRLADERDEQSAVLSSLRQQHAKCPAAAAAAGAAAVQHALKMFFPSSGAGQMPDAVLISSPADLVSRLAEVHRLMTIASDEIAAADLDADDIAGCSKDLVTHLRARVRLLSEELAAAQSSTADAVQRHAEAVAAAEMLSQRHAEEAASAVVRATKVKTPSKSTADKVEKERSTAKAAAAAEESSSPPPLPAAAALKQGKRPKSSESEPVTADRDRAAGTGTGTVTTPPHPASAASSQQKSSAVPTQAVAPDPAMPDELQKIISSFPFDDSVVQEVAATLAQKAKTLSEVQKDLEQLQKAFQQTLELGDQKESDEVPSELVLGGPGGSRAPSAARATSPTAAEYDGQTDEEVSPRKGVHRARFKVSSSRSELRRDRRSRGRHFESSWPSASEDYHSTLPESTNSMFRRAFAAVGSSISPQHSIAPLTRVSPSPVPEFSPSRLLSSSRGSPPGGPSLSTTTPPLRIPKRSVHELPTRQASRNVSQLLQNFRFKMPSTSSPKRMLPFAELSPGSRFCVACDDPPHRQCGENATGLPTPRRTPSPLPFTSHVPSPPQLSPEDLSRGAKERSHSPPEDCSFVPPSQDSEAPSDKDRLPAELLRKIAVLGSSGSGVDGVSDYLNPAATLSKIPSSVVRVLPGGYVANDIQLSLASSGASDDRWCLVQKEFGATDCGPLVVSIPASYSLEKVSIPGVLYVSPRFVLFRSDITADCTRILVRVSISEVVRYRTRSLSVFKDGVTFVTLDGSFYDFTAYPQHLAWLSE